jgi:hemerythrin-like domain-containing protein
MSSSPSDPAAATGREPIDEFSKCHAGIISQLTSLRELPALLEPAAQARRIAGESLAFFRRAVYGHHEDEERDLFPAVLASAEKGAEHERVRSMVDRLTAEHRSVEKAWEALEPDLKAIAHGKEAEIDSQALARLIDRYIAHAVFEEREFLPLSEQILGRNSNHMAALGVSLHARHVLPEVLQRYGSGS